MTWVWFLILGVVALVNGRRIVGWVSGWQQDRLKPVSAIGLIFFGVMALFGNSPKGDLWPFQIAAAAGGVLALFTINEQIRRSSAVEGAALQRAIDQRRRREREERRQRSDAAEDKSPARAAELLEEQAQQPGLPPPPPEDSDDAGRYVVIQVDEGDGVRGVTIMGAPQAAVGSEEAPEVVVETAAPAPQQPPSLMPVDEPVEVDTSGVAERPSSEAAEPVPVADPQTRPSGPVSLGGGGALRASGPVKLGASVAPQASGPVSLRTGGVRYEPQVDRSRLAAKPDEAVEPADEAHAPTGAEDSEGVEE